MKMSKIRARNARKMPAITTNIFHGSLPPWAKRKSMRVFLERRNHESCCMFHFMDKTAQAWWRRPGLSSFELVFELSHNNPMTAHSYDFHPCLRLDHHSFRNGIHTAPVDFG